MVKTGSAWAGSFVTLDSTGALATPSSGPAGVLYVDGAANGATVTITGSNPYKWAVTLPSLTAGQRVDMYITATIATIATAGFVASDQADTVLLSEVKTETAAILEDTGTTIPGTITTIDNEIAVIDGIVDAILVDTGTDIPAALTTIDNFLDTEVAAILEDTGTTLPAALTAIQADLDNPDQYKADVSALATAVNLATVDTVVDAIKLKTDLIPTDPAETSDIPSAASISDAVWDELIAGHAIAGSTGATLAASGGASDPLLNQVPGAYASGTAGAALGRIGSGQITTVSPVAQSGDVETIMGDDYSSTDARALDWTDTSASWPTLTDATIAVTIRGVSSYAGSVVTATGDSKKVRLELTDVQTAAIPAGWYPFQVIATLTSGNVVTLVEGNWLSKERLSST